MSRGARLVSTGGALPSRVVTNEDLSKTLDTNNEWIVERTGIRERRIGESTVDLAVEAATQALGRAEYTIDSIDLLIVATITPDQKFPAAAALVANKLGFTGPTFDLNAACSGFVHGLITATSLVETHTDRILLVGAETMSSVVDQTDRSTAILFGDGAGAAIIEAADGPSSLLGFDWGTDADGARLLFAERDSCLKMDGKEVFRRAVRSTTESSLLALKNAGVSASDIALFVPHQANARILEAVCDRIEIGLDKTAIMLETTGNTSAASIPLALDQARTAGRVQPGDLVLLSGFGAGMAWSSVVWKI